MLHPKLICSRNYSLSTNYLVPNSFLTVEMVLFSNIQDTLVELQHSRRLMLIAIIYFIFLIIFVIKKTFVIVCYKPNHTLCPVECLKNPALRLAIIRASWNFSADLTSAVNFWIMIFTKSKFRDCYAEILRSATKCHLCFKTKS